MGAVPGRTAQRCRGHPGRHDERRHPYGCHGRDARPRAAQLRGHLYQRRRPMLRSPAAEPAREPVVPHAVPADPDPADAHSRSPDADPPRRGRQPFGQGRGPRRRSQSERGRPDRVRTQSRDHGALHPLRPGLIGGRMPKFQGAIFDVDGVLVDSPHQKAWRESLRELMEAGWRDIRDQTTWSPDAFTPHVYQQYVSGKPRLAGALTALNYFHVPDAEKRVAEYAQRKQEMVVRLIEAGDFTAYPDALRFVIAAKDAGLLIADASSSKNAGLVLRKIRLDTFARAQGISSPSLRPGLSLLDSFDAA